MSGVQSSLFTSATLSAAFQKDVSIFLNFQVSKPRRTRAARGILRVIDEANKELKSGDDEMAVPDLPPEWSDMFSDAQKRILSSNIVDNCFADEDAQLRQSAGQLIGALSATNRQCQEHFIRWIEQQLNTFDLQDESTDLYVVLTVVEAAGEYCESPWRRQTDGFIGGFPLLLSCVLYRCCVFLVEEFNDVSMLKGVMELVQLMCVQLHIVTEVKSTTGLSCLVPNEDSKVIDEAIKNNQLPHPDGHAFFDLVDILVGLYLSKHIDEQVDIRTGEVIQSILLRTLTQLDILWRNFTIFSTKLLNKFVEDLRRLCKINETSQHLKNMTKRSKALKFCFLINFLIDSIAGPNKNSGGSVQWSMWPETLDLFLGEACIFITTKISDSKSYYIDAIHCQYLNAVSILIKTYCHQHSGKIIFVEQNTLIESLVERLIEPATAITHIKSLIRLGNAAVNIIKNHVTRLGEADVARIVTSLVLKLIATSGHVRAQQAALNIVEAFTATPCPSSISATQHVTNVLLQNMEHKVQYYRSLDKNNPSAIVPRYLDIDSALLSIPVILHPIKEVSVNISKNTTADGSNQVDFFDCAVGLQIETAIRVANIMKLMWKSIPSHDASDNNSSAVSASHVISKCANLVTTLLVPAKSLSVVTVSVPLQFRLAAQSIMNVLHGLLVDVVGARYADSYSKPRSRELQNQILQLTLCIVKHSVKISSPRIISLMDAVLRLVERCLNAAASGAVSVRSHSSNGVLRDVAIDIFDTMMSTGGYANQLYRSHSYAIDVLRFARRIRQLVSNVCVSHTNEPFVPIVQQRLLKVLGAIGVLQIQNALFNIPTGGDEIPEHLLHTDQQPYELYRQFLHTLFEIIRGERDIYTFVMLQKLKTRFRSRSKIQRNNFQNAEREHLNTDFFDSGTWLVEKCVVFCFQYRFKTFLGGAPETCKGILDLANILLSEIPEYRMKYVQQRHLDQTKKEAPSSLPVSFALRAALFLLFMHRVESALELICSTMNNDDMRATSVQPVARKGPVVSDYLQPSFATKFLRDIQMNTATRGWYQRNRHVFEEWISGPLRMHMVNIALVSDNKSFVLHHVWKRLHVLEITINSISEQISRLPTEIEIKTNFATVESAVRSHDRKLHKAAVAVEKCLIPAFETLAHHNEIDGATGLRSWCDRVLGRLCYQHARSRIGKCYAALKAFSPSFLKVDSVDNANGSNHLVFDKQMLCLQTPEKPILFSDAVLNAFISDAAGHYEDALPTYQQILAEGSSLSNATAALGSTVVQVLLDRSIHCLFSLRDWQGMSQWVRTLHSTKKFLLSSTSKIGDASERVRAHRDCAKFLIPPVPIKLLQALAQFDSQQLDGARSALKHLPQFDSSLSFDSTPFQYNWHCQHGLLDAALDCIDAAKSKYAQRAIPSQSQIQAARKKCLDVAGTVMPILLGLSPSMEGVFLPRFRSCVASLECLRMYRTFLASSVDRKKISQAENMPTLLPNDPTSHIFPIGALHQAFAMSDVLAHVRVTNRNEMDIPSTSTNSDKFHYQRQTLLYCVQRTALNHRNFKLANRLLIKEQLYHHRSEWYWRYNKVEYNFAFCKYRDALMDLRDLSKSLVLEQKAKAIMKSDHTSNEHHTLCDALHDLCIVALVKRAKLALRFSNTNNSIAYTDLLNLTSAGKVFPKEVTVQDLYPEILEEEKVWMYETHKNIVVNYSTDFMNQQDVEAEWCLRMATSLAPHRSTVVYRYATFLYNSALYVHNQGKTNSQNLLQLYRASVLNYFKFLKIVYGQGADNWTEHTSTVQMTHNPDDMGNEDQVISATLRILRLLVKHGSDFQAIFKQGVSETPLIAWSHILPQLCSRLRHPNPFVATQVRALLLRMIMQDPHKLLSTIVATADTAATRTSSSTFEGAESSENVPIIERQSGLHFLHREMCRRHPYLIATTERLFCELAKIAILFEDKWLKLLNQLRTDFNSRFDRFTAERRRVMGVKRQANPASDMDRVGISDDKSMILQQKFVALMRPLTLALDRLISDTFGTSSVSLTSHERNFARKFYARICQVRQYFASPRHQVDRRAVAATLKSLAHDIKAFGKAVRGLKIRDLSPWLATLGKKNVNDVSANENDQFERQCPLPGVGLQSGSSPQQSAINIVSMDSWCDVLRTKTRPKKLTFIGSDGQYYTYLLKGHEDLNLDERIMQFLRIVNSFLNSTQVARVRNLRALNYCVIPIGLKCGLIQWVKGTTPIYALYAQYRNEMYQQKLRHEERKHEKQNRHDKQTEDKTRSAAVRLHSRTKNENVNKQKNTANMHPAQLFYHFLMPALKARGLGHGKTNSVHNKDKTTKDAAATVSTLSRKDWPLDILRSVFLRLLKLSPPGVLQRQFSASSKSPDMWWNMVTRYSRSLGVSSIVGYVIGLGDRHLENILLHRASGELLHIDYNVCFDKGTTLRVPERVPFRLTRILHDGLGVVGLDGPFRIACEHTLSVLRKNKETLTTLLEAFVYDPLVDWSTDKEEDIERADVELDVSMELFVSRMSEEIHSPDLVSTSNAIIDLWEKGETMRHRMEELSNMQERVTLDIKNANMENVVLKTNMRDAKSAADKAKLDHQTTNQARWQALEAKMNSTKHISELCDSLNASIESFKSIAYMIVEQQHARPFDELLKKLVPASLLASSISSAKQINDGNINTATRHDLVDMRTQVVSDVSLWGTTGDHFFQQCTTENRRYSKRASHDSIKKTTRLPVVEVCRELMEKLPLGRTKRKLRDLMRIEREVVDTRMQLCVETNKILRHAQSFLENDYGPLLAFEIGLFYDFLSFTNHSSPFHRFPTREQLIQRFCTNGLSWNFLTRLEQCRLDENTFDDFKIAALDIFKDSNNSGSDIAATTATGKLPTADASFHLREMASGAGVSHWDKPSLFSTSAMQQKRKNCEKAYMTHFTSLKVRFQVLMAKMEEATETNNNNHCTTNTVVTNLSENILRQHEISFNKVGMDNVLSHFYSIISKVGATEEILRQHVHCDIAKWDDGCLNCVLSENDADKASGDEFGLLQEEEDNFEGSSDADEVAGYLNAPIKDDIEICTLKQKENVRIVTADLTDSEDKHKLVANTDHLRQTEVIETTNFPLAAIFKTACQIIPLYRERTASLMFDWDNVQSGLLRSKSEIVAFARSLLYVPATFHRLEVAVKVFSRLRRAAQETQHLLSILQNIQAGIHLDSNVTQETVMSRHTHMRADLQRGLRSLAGGAAIIGTDIGSRGKKSDAISERTDIASTSNACLVEFEKILVPFLITDIERPAALDRIILFMNLFRTSIISLSHSLKIALRFGTSFLVIEKIYDQLYMRAAQEIYEWLCAPWVSLIRENINTQCEVPLVTGTNVLLKSDEVQVHLQKQALNRMIAVANNDFNKQLESTARQKFIQDIPKLEPRLHAVSHIFEWLFLKNGQVRDDAQTETSKDMSDSGPIAKMINLLSEIYSRIVLLQSQSVGLKNKLKPFKSVNINDFSVDFDGPQDVKILQDAVWDSNNLQTQFLENFESGMNDISQRLASLMSVEDLRILPHVRFAKLNLSNDILSSPDNNFSHSEQIVSKAQRFESRATHILKTHVLLCAKHTKIVDRFRNLAVQQDTHRNKFCEIQDRIKNKQLQMEALKIDQQTFTDEVEIIVSDAQEVCIELGHAITRYLPALKQIQALLTSFLELPVLYTQSRAGRQAICLKRFLGGLRVDCQVHSHNLQIVHQVLHYDQTCNDTQESSVEVFFNNKPSVEQMSNLLNKLMTCVSDLVNRHRNIHDRVTQLAGGNLQDYQEDGEDDENEAAVTLSTNETDAAGISASSKNTNGNDMHIDIQTNNNLESSLSSTSSSFLLLDTNTTKSMTTRADLKNIKIATKDHTLPEMYSNQRQIQTQQRNEYAVKVLTRIEQKLSGQHHTGTKKHDITASNNLIPKPNYASNALSVPQQVQHIINEAMDKDRLCQMYEGWSAWI